LFGKIPVTEEIVDLAEIYGGHAAQQEGIIVLNLVPRQIEALIDLAKMIRKPPRRRLSGQSELASDFRPDHQLPVPFC